MPDFSTVYDVDSLLAHAPETPLGRIIDLAEDVQGPMVLIPESPAYGSFSYEIATLVQLYLNIQLPLVRDFQKCLNQP